MAEADASNTNSKNVPNVIKFVYDEFTSDKVKKFRRQNANDIEP